MRKRVDGSFTPNLLVILNELCPPAVFSRHLLDLSKYKREELEQMYKEYSIRIHTSLNSVERTDVDLCEFLALEVLLGKKEKLSQYLFLKELLFSVMKLLGYRVEANPYLTEWLSMVLSKLLQGYKAQATFLLYGLKVRE